MRSPRYLQSFCRKSSKLFGFVRKPFIWQLIVAFLLITALDLLDNTTIWADNEQIWFEDISSEAGFEVIESNTGAAWVDYDQDGFEDIYLGRHGYLPAMYRNVDGTGTFEEVTSDIGLDLYHDHHGFTWGDANNDGWPDLYITAGRASGGSLFLVNQNGSFIEKSAQAGNRNHWGRGRLARWADYNNDSFLDLYVGNDFAGSLGTENNKVYQNIDGEIFSDVSGETELVSDDLDTRGFSWGDYNGDGHVDLLSGGNSKGALTLYKNLGNGRFEDVTAVANIDTNSSAPTTDWGDYDNDGDLDFFIGRGSDGYGDMIRVINNRKIEFAGRVNADEDGFSFIHNGDQITLSLWHRDYGLRSKLIFIGSSAYNPDNSLNFVLSDNDSQNFGKPTYIVGDSAYKGIYIWKSNNEWHVHWNDKGDAFTGIVTSNGTMTSVTPIDFEPYVSESAKANSLYRNNGDGTFEDVTAISGIGNYPATTTHGVTWVDFDNDGDLDLYEVNQGDVDIGNEANRLYRNDKGTFIDVANTVNLQPFARGYGKCGTWGDYDKDGFLDLFLVSNWWVGPLAGPEKLYRNQGNSNNWLQLTLIGVESNRQGIGARVEIQTTTGLQYRDTSISSGSECQNSSTVHFGLGQENAVNQLTVTWPSGIVDTFNNISANQHLTIIEGSSDTPLVELDDAQNLSADPNSQVVFTHTITNRSSLKDSYDLEAIAALPNWSVVVSPTTIGPLEPDENATFTVIAQVPHNASANTQNAIEITTQSQMNNLYKTTVIDTITVNPVYDVELTGNTTGYVLPNEQAVFHYTLTNTGNTADSFELIANPQQTNWSATLSPTNSGALVSQESASITLTIQAPPDAITDSQGIVIVTARSQTDSATETTLTSTLTVGTAPNMIYLPFIFSN